MTKKLTGRRGNPHGRGKPPTPTLAAMPTSWDRGAEGPANRLNLREEPATDIDPETGRETRNPNLIKRHRRQAWVHIYAAQGKLTAKQAAAADTLRMAAEGMQERDPIAALGIRAPGGSDPEASRVDRRAYFRELWANIPVSSRPVIERVVLDDQPIWHGNASQRDRHMLRLSAGLDAIA